MKGSIMKKLTILLLSVVTLSGCSFFQNERKTISQDSITSVESTVETIEETNDQETESASQNANTSSESIANEDFSGVFNESELSTTDLPNTSLDESISYQELNQEMVTFYNDQFDEDAKEMNSQPVDDDTMAQLQYSLDNNGILQGLQATADQVVITIDGQDNYVTRVTVPMTYEESVSIVNDNDILLMNEALAQVGGLRLAQINYYDPTTDTLTPMHLANANHSLFYNDQLANN